MYARIVRFTGVSPERIAEIEGRIEENDGPPPGVDSKGMQIYYDADQSTAIFVGQFETVEKMSEAAAVFDAMDSGDTPGSRASVDMCELKIEREM